MTRLIIFPLVLSSLFGVNLSASIMPPKTDSINIFKSDSEKISLLDEANDIKEVYSASLKGNLNEKKLENLAKSVRHHPDFSPYYWWLNEILTLSKQPVDNSYGTNCNLAIKRVSENLLKNSVLAFCTSQISFQVIKSLNSKSAINYQHLTFLLNNHGNLPHVLQTLSRVAEFFTKTSAAKLKLLQEDFHSHKVPLIKINDKFLATSRVVSDYAKQLRLLEKKNKLTHGTFLIETNQLLSKKEVFQNDDWERIFAIAKGFSQDKDYEKANILFNQIVSQDHNLEAAANSVFEIMWPSIVENRFKDAVKEAHRLNIESVMKKYHSNKLLFWYAFSLEKSGQADQAKKFYQTLAEKDPFSFYSIMSTKSHTGGNSYAKYVSTSQTAQTNFDFKQYLSNLRRIWVWSKIHHRGFLNLEQDYLVSSNSPNKEDVLIQSLKVIADAGNNISAFNFVHQLIISKTLKVNRDTIELMFPSPFDQEISNLNAPVDRHVINALIRQESGFNPNAKSRVGARGLMQIMPYTAKVLDRRIASVDLAKPKVNLKLGTTFLQMMLEKFDQNLVYALAAYNAGPHRVVAWQKEHFNPDESILVNIESIPFLETRNYVKLIFRNLYFYKTLKDSNIAKSDISEYNKIYDLHLGFKH